MKLFLDLDGVMADFDGHFEACFGIPCKGMDVKRLWQLIGTRPGFFRDMPVCAGALGFFRDVRYQGPIILTACPASAYADVAAQKRAWVREHLGPDVMVLPALGRSSKPLFMHAPRDVLIDDWPPNVEAWRAAGGRAVLHKGNFKDTNWKMLKAFPDKGPRRAP